MKTTIFSALLFSLAFLNHSWATDDPTVANNGISVQLILNGPDALLAECDVVEVEIRVTNYTTSNKNVEVSFFTNGTSAGGQLGIFDLGDFTGNPQGTGFLISIPNLKVDPGATESRFCSFWAIFDDDFCRGYGFNPFAEVRVFVQDNNDPSCIAEAADAVSIIPVCLADGSVSPFKISEWVPPLNSGIWPDDTPIRDPDFACGITSTSPHQSLIVRGDMIVDVDYCIKGDSLTNRAKLYMFPGARIRIEPGVELDLKWVDVIGGCGEMWSTIAVQGKLDAEEVLISDAEFGVTAVDGSSVDLEGCHLKNNYVGFYCPLESYGSLSTITSNGFYGNLFETDGLFLAPYQGQTRIPDQKGFAGIEVHNLDYFDIHGAASPKFTLYNVFKNLANGIISKDSRLSIWHPQFIDIVEYNNAYPYSGRGIYQYYEQQDLQFAELELIGNGQDPEYDDLTFFNCTEGVHIQGGDALVRFCSMDEMDYGVRVSECIEKDVTIHFNDIRVKKIGVETKVNHFTDFLITQNYFRVDADGAPVNSYGIKSNEVILLYGHFSGNEIDLWNAKYGIFLRFHAYTNVWGNTINFGNPLLPLTPYVGIFNESGSYLEFQNNVINGDAEPNQDNWKESTGMYFQDSYQPLVECNSVDLTEIGIQFYGDNDVATFRGNSFGEHFNGLLLGRYLNGGLVDGNARIGLKSEPSNLMHQGNVWYDMNASNSDPSDNRYGAVHLSDNINDFEIIESRFFVDETESQDFMPEVFLYHFPEDQFWFVDQLEPGASFACPEEGLAGSPNEHTLNHLEKFTSAPENISSILMQMIEAKAAALNIAPDEKMLSAVAGLCPLKEGEAVYAARVLLGAGEYDDGEICNQDRLLAQDDHVDKETIDLTIFPNPGNGIFQISFNAIEHGQEGLIHIYHASGQLRKRVNMTSLSNKTELDLTDLPPGLYFVEASIPGKRAITSLVIY